MRALILVAILTFGCSTATKSPGPVDEFLAGKMLLEMVDKEEKLNCVADPELYLRTLRPLIEEKELELQAFLIKERPSPDQCLAECVCDVWLDVHSELEQKIYAGETLEHLQENALNQPIPLCLKRVKAKFCESDLFKKLDAEKANFAAP